MKNAKLIYKAPAKIWTDALALGNGRLGAMVYGRLGREKLQFNEETLWNGYKDELADNPDCAEKLDEIRSLIFAGKLAEAEEIASKHFVCRGHGGGNKAHPAITLPYGSFQTAGQLYITLHAEDAAAEGYERSLNIENGLSEVKYSLDGASFRREYFASESYRCICGRISSDAPICAELEYTRDDAAIEYRGDLIVMRGSFEKGIDFAAAVKVCGAAESSGDRIKVNGDFSFFVSVRTSYDGTEDVEAAAISDVLTAAKADFEEIKADSLARVSEMMNRCAVDIAPESDAALDERLAAIKDGEVDEAELASLAELYFNFGRYLLISSSRSCILPANLQGIWTNDYSTVWSADYHININIQMNYWLSEVCRLPELGDVFMRYIKFLSKHGADTAKVNYGMSGWVAHTITNPWGFTAPGNGFSWGSFMCAGAWCCEHIFERWLYSRNREFLAEYYPVMKGSCEFFLDFLTEDPNTGYLVTAPSNSPENHYRDPNSGKTVAICAGPTMDNSILYELFSNTAAAARELEIDSEFAAKLDAIKQKLPPIKIGKHGQIMEWQEDYEETEPGHRHLSMLYALHPSNLITKSQTPELFEAAKVSIERRLSSGGGHTGWSRAWVINFYSRLGMGDECLDHIRALLAKSTYPNLFDSHPPFQIDGNFGGCAGIAEMLLQSHESFVNLLPALPAKWKQGSFRGLRARSGWLVSADWKDGRLTRFELEAELGGSVEVRYGERAWRLTLCKGSRVSVLVD